MSDSRQRGMMHPGLARAATSLFLCYFLVYAFSPLSAAYCQDCSYDTPHIYILELVLGALNRQPDTAGHASDERALLRKFRALAAGGSGRDNIAQQMTHSGVGSRPMPESMRRCAPTEDVRIAAFAFDEIYAGHSPPEAAPAAQA